MDLLKHKAQELLEIYFIKSRIEEYESLEIIEKLEIFILKQTQKDDNFRVFGIENVNDHKKNLNHLLDVILDNILIYMKSINLDFIPLKIDNQNLKKYLIDLNNNDDEFYFHINPEKTVIAINSDFIISKYNFWEYISPKEKYLILNSII